MKKEYLLSLEDLGKHEEEPTEEENKFLNTHYLYGGSRETDKLIRNTL
jgi:hypothetical protein